MSILSDRLFIRDAELIIGTKITNAPVEPNNARSIKTRIAFNINKNNLGESNKSTITIYNISQETRNFLEQKNLVVFLKAGYVGALSTIFFGDVVTKSEKRAGSDVLTTLECGDQEQQLATANLQIGLNPGATNIQLLQAAAAALQLSIPERQLALIPIRNFPNGVSYSGTAGRLLTRESKSVGLEFSIQDGEIQILKPGTDDGQEAVLITPQTGLIGFPTKTEDGFELISLLNGQVRPGRAIKMESKQIQGVFGAKAGKVAATSLDGNGIILICQKAVYNGDTGDGPWEVKIQGPPKETEAA